MWVSVTCKVWLTEIPGRPATAGTAKLSTVATNVVEVLMVVATTLAVVVVMVTMDGWKRLVTPVGIPIHNGGRKRGGLFAERVRSTWLEDGGSE